ncbi:MAG: peptidase M28 [Flavobacteriaceae bacterium]|nr:peptidase M28 [Flavobacteriaceae bacterium]
MKKILILFLFLTGYLQSQIISEELVKSHIKILSSDEMEGRKAGTAGIEKAAKYIESEFEKMGLAKFSNNDSYRQNFKSQGLELFNIVGFLEGKSKAKEIVVISAHYDHLGIDQKLKGDKIFNGANDNASGVSGVLAIADYYSKKRTNERSLLFIAFTAEEMGLIGSNYFGTTIHPEDYVAGINIEMIGKESPFGPNTAWLTGFNRTTFGQIVQKNLLGSEFQLFPDPYKDFDLFYRSDNAALAKIGIPAHTISTSPMDQDLDYHMVTDEFNTLNQYNISKTIEAIIIGTRSIIMGKETPSRPRVSMQMK